MGRQASSRVSIVSRLTGLANLSISGLYCVSSKPLGHIDQQEILDGEGAQCIS